MKISFLVKSITGLCATTFIVSAATYAIVRKEEPQKIDFSAFKNVAANIQYISESPERKPAVAVSDVTGSIVNTIEKEVRGKILRSRYSMKPKAIVAQKVIVKNWNDIRPTFAAVDMKLDGVKPSAAPSTNNEISKFEINNKELIKLYGFEVDSRQYESFANTMVAGYEVPTLDIKDIKKDSFAPKVATQENPNDIDELLMFDYSAPASVEDNVQVAEASTTKIVAPKASTKKEVTQVEVATKENSEIDELLVSDYSANKEELAPVSVEDTVQVAQASTTTRVEDIVAPEASIKEEIAQAEIATKENPVNDDLVMFDYSPNKKESASVVDETASKRMFDAPLSNSVKEAIAREVGKSPAVAMNVTTQRKMLLGTEVQKTDLAEVMENEDNLVFDYSKQPAAAVSRKEITENAVSAFTAASAPDTTTQAEFIIRAKEINLNTLKSRQSFGFEFVPDYDRAERTDDQTSGEIKLGYSLSGDVSTQTGVVQSQGLISTRVELNLLKKGIEVPLFNEEGIQKFLEKKQTDVQGNLLMIAVDPSIVDVEIDSEHQFKIYLSEKFKLVESQANASYVLFLGVKTGNIALRYLLSNKESAQKIVYVGDGEMYFEDPDFVNTQREMYTFTTRSLLGRKVKELNINGSDISFFGTKTFAKKKALNAYEIKVPELVDNSRKYLEFKHLGNSLFVGTNSTTEIEIPGKDFIGKVLEANDMSEIGSRCLVQINLTKDLRDIKANGKNKNGEMFAETTYLDNDGNFSRDNLELSEKVFVTGDMEGIFNVRLDYSDGSTDFLKTFCSEGSYLVEQL